MSTNPQSDARAREAFTVFWGHDLSVLSFVIVAFLIFFVLLVRTECGLFTNLPRNFINDGEVVSFLEEKPSLLPIYMDSSSEKVIWLEVGDHHFTESKFSCSIKNILQKSSSPKIFETNAGILTQDYLLNRSKLLHPSGFIFFIHRCGSTILSKALAQAKSNIVINEATILHEGLWSYLSQDWREPIVANSVTQNIIRNLILSLGRPRAKNHKALFIKFNPWHSIFIETIISAFPDVPCLFLYRDIAEILVSVSQVSAPIMSNIRGTEFAAYLTHLTPKRTIEMSYIEYFSSLYMQFILTALNVSSQNLFYLNYKKLNAENLSLILEKSFRYTPLPSELESMKKQFIYYSKDDSNATLFYPDELQKQNAVSHEVRQSIKEFDLSYLYERLANSKRNIL